MIATEIDVTARCRAAEVYRHFATGLLSNDQMEAALPRSSERGLHDVFFCGIWPLYDDLHEHRLTGRYRLTPEGRDHVARIILFLHSSLPYRWPTSTGWRGAIEMLVSLLSFGRFHPGRLRARAPSGDVSVWPFFKRTEYELALKDPPYFNGTKSGCPGALHVKHIF
jgi:hypothetical protein